MDPVEDRSREHELRECRRELQQSLDREAAIAIENERLLKELQARNTEVTEALEQQTATADILKVISSSPTDIQPVLDAVAENAARLCEATDVVIRRLDGGRLRVVAHFGSVPLTVDAHELTRGSVGGRAVLERRTVHVHDFLSSASRKEYPDAPTRPEHRTILAVPLVREGAATGVILMRRLEVRPFTDRQIQLLETFADQAVIAIENARLFNETKGALEQQTVISEILRIISGSPTDTQPVFDAIVKSGARLFGGMTVSLNLVQEEGARVVASTLPMHDGGEAYSIPRDDDSYPVARAMLRRETVQIPDILASDWVSETVRQRAGQRGWRAIMIAPLLRESTAIGAIAVNRANPGPFTDKQVALVQTFADQAVIAIENVRLFKELQARNTEVTEALEQQTATADILKVISSSPTDTQPVFYAVAESAARLCGAHDAVIRLVEGNEHHVVAHHGPIPIRPPYVVTRATMVGRAIVEARTVHIPDVSGAHVQEEYPESRSNAAGRRTLLAVPMVRQGKAIGVVLMRRQEVRPFTDKQIMLLETFAAQAVIAIENVRLFKEIQDKNRQLEIASRHKSEFLASMSHELRTPLNAILGFNEMIIHEMYGEVPPDMKIPLDDIQSSGKHLLRLINNVLDLAKIEAGRMELALADYSIQDTAESVRSALRPLAAEKKIEFIISVPDDTPLVYGDSGRIMQCLVNLAGNSLKFTKAGKVEISARHHDGLLTCCVADTGIGIPSDKIGGLFTEFKQTDATIASEYGGTGLGLSITRKFIEMHGGRIWVESEVGQGSRFIFEIPLRAVAQSTERAHA